VCEGSSDSCDDPGPGLGGTNRWGCFYFFSFLCAEARVPGAPADATSAQPALCYTIAGPRIGVLRHANIKQKKKRVRPRLGKRLENLRTARRSSPEQSAVQNRGRRRGQERASAEHRELVREMTGDLPPERSHRKHRRAQEERQPGCSAGLVDSATSRDGRSGQNESADLNSSSPANGCRP